MERNLFGLCEAGICIGLAFQGMFHLWAVVEVGAADRSRPSSRLFLPLNEVSSRRRSEPITGKRCEEGNERPVHPAQYTHLVLDSFVLLVGNHDVQYNCLA